jgi:hypothetical protein
MTKKFYHHEKACADTTLVISAVIYRQIWNRIHDSKFFGLMINESTDISVTNHTVVFASYLEENYLSLGL